MAAAPMPTPHAVTAPYLPHDHDGCVGSALARAQALCRERGVRLTAIREQVLSLIWSGHKPRGAYDVLEDLGRAAGKRVAPLTVYRALDFLVAQGLVHRIESLNAYIGCSDPGQVHAGQFLVCRTCGSTTEVNDQRIAAAITGAAADMGFTVQRQTVEIQGTCPACRTA